MKKSIKLFAIAFPVLSMVFSCSKPEIQDPVFQPKVLTAHVDDNFVDTKTSLNGLKVVWSDQDVISAFDGDNTNHPSTAISVTNNGSKASFTVGTLSLDDDVYYALYPYQESAVIEGSGQIAAVIPTVQTATAGSFAPGANLAIADGGVTDLYFKNGCGLLGVTVNNSNIRKITLELPEQYGIAGNCYISITGGAVNCYGSPYTTGHAASNTVALEGTFEIGQTYYMAVLEGEYEGGMNITVESTDGKVAKLSNSNTLSINKNEILLFAKLPDLSSWWTSSDEGESIANTKETAYTADQAIALIDAGNDLETPVYVKGRVKSIVTTSANVTKYGNVDLYLETSGETSFELYRCKDLNDENFSSAYLKANDEIIAYGTLTKFVSSSTGAVQYELTSCYLVDYKESAVLVSSIEVPSAVSLEVGQTTSLTATVRPATAGDKSLNWSSDAPSVVTVDDSGLLTAIGVGTATITITANDGSNVSATCSVTVTEVSQGELTYPKIKADFSAIDNFDDWTGGYSQHVLNYDDFSVDFASANKQSSTITDVPVTKGGQITITMKGTARVSSMYLMCKQWLTKEQTISLAVSKDGTNFTDITPSATDFVLKAPELDDAKVLKVTFSSPDNQIGISALYLNRVPDRSSSTLNFGQESLEVTEKESASYSITTDYDGTLSVSSNSSNITASITGHTLNIDASNASVGDEATLTVSGSATLLYDEVSATIKVVAVKKGTHSTYQHIFTAKPSTGSDVTLSGLSWTISATNLGSYNSTNYAGVQFGTKKATGIITLNSTDNFSYDGKNKIKEVRVWLNTGADGAVTAAVSVGSTSVASDGTTVVKNGSAGNDYSKASKVTFTPSSLLSGPLTITATTGSNTVAGYICAIEVDVE